MPRKRRLIKSSNVRYTGFEGVKTLSSNFVEVGYTGRQFLFRFYNQKPAIGKTIIEEYDDGSCELAREVKDIEFALQAELTLPKGAALFLIEQIKELDLLHKQQKQQDRKQDDSTE